MSLCYTFMAHSITDIGLNLDKNLYLKKGASLIFTLHRYVSRALARGNWKLFAYICQ